MKFFVVFFEKVFLENFFWKNFFGNFFLEFFFGFFFGICFLPRILSESEKNINFLKRTLFEAYKPKMMMLGEEMRPGLRKN